MSTPDLIATRKTALYRKVLEDLQHKIDEGILAQGEKLPSVSALCAEYGVSNITISAALRHLVSAGYVESRPRLGIYVRRRDGAAADLKGERVIAFLVPIGKAPFFMEIIHGAEEILGARGYRLLITNTQDDPHLEAQQLQSLARQVAGLLITPVTAGHDYGIYCSLLKRRIPMVFVDHYLEGLNVPSVTTDNEEGGYQATKHLLETGRERIFVVMDGEETSTQERTQGYRRALNEAGITYDPRYLVRLRQSGKVDYAGLYSLLNDHAADTPFGIFAMNEYLARDIYVLLRETSLNIPADVAIIGFDDAFAPFLDPPLSTVRQDLRTMGERAAELLVKQLQNGANYNQSVRLKPQLIIRNSTDSESAFCPRRHYNLHLQRSPREVMLSS